VTTTTTSSTPPIAHHDGEKEYGKPAAPMTHIYGKEELK
jgi:hypothetical protein